MILDPIAGDVCIAVQALSNDGSGVTALTERLRSEILSKVTAFGESLALRCLPLAHKAYEELPCAPIFQS